MKIISKIINVSQFSITENGLLHLSNTGEVFLNYKLIKSNVETLAYIDSEKNFFFGEKGKLNTYCEDLNSSEFLDLEYISPFFNTLSESIYICYEFKVDDFSTKIIKYNILLKQKEKTIISDTKLKVLFGNKIYLVLFDSEKENCNSITLYNHQTETTLWQYSVADLGAEKVSKILGVFGQVLVVVCEMAVYPEHILIGIDINDGKLLWNVNLPQYLMHSNLFYYEQNNSIISLRRNFLWEFSLSSMEVLREKQLPETFKYNSLNVQVELASLYGDLIYFAGKDLENVRPSALVGVFDLKTEKLVDVHDLESDGTFTVGGNSRPQVSGNKIYVQDTKNTLHILEREFDALNEQG